MDNNPYLVNYDAAPVFEGGIESDEVVTYRFNGQLQVESMRRFWARMSDAFDVLKQKDGLNEYIDLSGVEVFDSEIEDFTPVFTIYRNTATDWKRIISNGARNAVVADDQPVQTYNRGVVKASEIHIGDELKLDYGQYHEDGLPVNPDIAWILGFIICDGSYQFDISGSIAVEGEDEIKQKWITCCEKYFDMVPKIVTETDPNSHMIRMYMQAKKQGDLKERSTALFNFFEGYKKDVRHIPGRVFAWNRLARMSFLAGMIDADGHIRKEKNYVILGSVNRELAIQEALLSQSLGYGSKIYFNKVATKENGRKNQHRIEYVPDIDLIRMIQCQKKRDNFECFRKTHNPSGIKINTVRKIESITDANFSYGLITESKNFTASGWVQHDGTME